MFKYIIRYFKRPNNIPIYDISLQEKIKMTGIIFLWDIICTLLISMIVAILWANKISEINEGAYVNESVKSTSLFYIICIRKFLITPVIEEFAFRYMLTKFDIRKVKISVSLIVGFAIEFILYDNCQSISISLAKIFQNPIAPFGIIFGIAIIIYGVTSCFNGILNKLNKYWDQYFYLVFYGSSFLFCIGHYHRTPLYLLPMMFVSAVLLGYIRVKIGLKYSISIHMLSNILLSIGMFF